MLTTAPGQTRNSTVMTNEALWYKDAIIYEVHVRAFADSDGDGVGDFAGLTRRLDYLQDLGVTALWLLPFYPSPLKDDGYDIADYTNIHPSYGTMRDFKVFLKEAHRRSLRVITELVINHTSDQHTWFQRARQAPAGSTERDFYVWSDTPDRYADARIIFKDFETSNWTWDAVAKAYYWHRFYAHQPDLNFTNPAVCKAVKKAMDFWLDLGVDGLRLDAVPYLYEQDGTNCENLPETHAFLRELRQHVDERHPQRLLLAEANQWPEDARTYFGEGDECHMAFHFPLMPRLFMALRQEKRYPITEILEQTPAIPETCQWAIFLRNHDELTLEMVTDQERDYMYGAYAQDQRMRINLGIRRRLAPLLENSRRKIELLNGLLMSLPGTPVLYYGDEIGMGDNIYLGDRDGVRTPMQWSADRNAGFSEANPQQLYLPVVIDPAHHYEMVNVEREQHSTSSLLWWMKRLMAIRARFLAFSRGRLTVLHPDNGKVLAFLREHGVERILVVANLSRFVQCARLELPELKGYVPVELFGQTPFPAISKRPYFLTMGPHAFYWFALEAPKTAKEPMQQPEHPRTLSVTGRWDVILEDEKGRRQLERLLLRYVPGCRWFGSKGRPIQSIHIIETIPLDTQLVLTALRVKYLEGEPDQYLLPLAFAEASAAEEQVRRAPQSVIGLLHPTKQSVGMLYDGLYDPACGQQILDGMVRKRTYEGQAGTLSMHVTAAARKSVHTTIKAHRPTMLGGEQSNTSLIWGQTAILKCFRRLERGINPDVELGRYLTEKAQCTSVPQVWGWLEYRRDRRDEPTMLGMLQAYVPNEGDAWRYTLEELGEYTDRVIASDTPLPMVAQAQMAVVDVALQEPDATIAAAIGPYLSLVALLGTRTAELHLALAQGRDAALAPEPFSSLYQRSLYQSMCSLTRDALRLLRTRLPRLRAGLRKDAQALLDDEQSILHVFESVRTHKMTVTRIRCHGDFHLGQVLFTGKDFMIIDFEGEPARSLSERRLKRSPLCDVAGMIRSFHYAASSVLMPQADQPQHRRLRTRDIPRVTPWVRAWCAWVSAAFLRSYLHTAGSASFIPADRADLQRLLRSLLLEKAVYELAYELNNRPDWVHIPLHDIRRLLEATDAG